MKALGAMLLLVLLFVGGAVVIFFAAGPFAAKLFSLSLGWIGIVVLGWRVLYRRRQ